jgi:hypothetical protein
LVCTKIAPSNSREVVVVVVIEGLEKISSSEVLVDFIEFSANDSSIKRLGVGRSPNRSPMLLPPDA